MDGKPYCEECQSRCYLECCRCRRPFDSLDCFNIDPFGKRCDSCHRKLLKERMSKSGRMDDSDTDIFTDSELSSNEKAVRFKKAKKTVSKKPTPKTPSTCLTSDSEDLSDNEAKKTKKTPKKQPVKRAAPKPPRLSPKKRKSESEPAQALKNLLYGWTQEEECLKKVLDGRRVAFVPVFI